MLQVIDKWLNFTEADELGQLSFAERVLYWSIVLTPLWWLLGIQTLFFPAVAIGLLIRSFRFDKLLTTPMPICVWAWLGIAIAMIWTAFLGLIDVGFPPFRVVSTLVTFFKGYFLIVSCFILPFWNPIRSKVITRAVAWMAVGYGITVIIQFILLFLGLWDQAIYPPLARLIPGDKLSLLVKPAVFQPFFGIPLPRTSLYMADPPIPGICGLLSFFICYGESNRRLRYLSIAGCLLALLVSQSRLAWVCFPTVYLISLSFRRQTVRQGSLWGAFLLFLGCAILGLTLADLLHQALGVFTEARAASSADRSLVVSLTLEAWQERPWLGWGISRGEVKWYIYEIVLGSFSTYAGVLYLHGVLGYTCLITALASTVWNLWRIALTGNHLAQGAVASFLALCLFLEGLPLTWICVYFWFYFIWLGNILVQHQSQSIQVSSWEQLV